MTTRSLATTITVLLTTAVLSACGTGAGSPDTAFPSATDAPQAAQTHDQADVTFVQQMIPHHSQAVEMSKLAPDHAGSPRVKDLAARIQAAQHSTRCSCG